MSGINYLWFVGVDWGEKKHQVCLCDGSGEVRGSRAFSHEGSGLLAMGKWLAKRTGASPESVAVGIERPNGAVVARGLRSNTRVFREVRQLPALIERLRERTRTLDRLIRQRVQLQQQIRSVLVDYFPQLVELAGGMKNLGSPFFLEMWKRAPTPAEAGRLQRGTVERRMRRYGITRITVDRAFELLRAEPLSVAPGVTEAAVARIETHLAVLKVVIGQIVRAEKEMTELLDEFSQTVEARYGLEPARAEAVSGVPESSASPEDLGGVERSVPDVVSVLRSRPGLGDRAAARLLAWGYEPLMRGDFLKLRALCGVIPRQIQSGKSDRAALRRAVPSCLQQAAYILAMGVVRWDRKVAARNRQLKAAGKKPARRYRSIANRELRVLCAMVRTRTFFDPDFPTRRQVA